MMACSLKFSGRVSADIYCTYPIISLVMTNCTHLCSCCLTLLIVRLLVLDVSENNSFRVIAGTRCSLSNLDVL